MNLLDVRIGTLVNGNDKSAGYIKQILPHGFESFSITFWKKIDVDLKKLAAQVKDVIGPADVKINCIAMFGNPLEDPVTAKGWEQLIDAASLFGANVIGGFAGRLKDKPIPESMPRFKEVFLPLAKRAKDKGLRLAFENCEMGGDWERGDWNIAHAPTAWEMMFNEVPLDNIGLEFEPCHQIGSFADPILVLRKYVQRVFHLHGKDATVNWDIIREYGIRAGKPYYYHRTPGFGDTNWSNIITVLREGGFKGSIDIEGWHDPVYRDELEMTGQVAALQYLKRCRGGETSVANPK
jgi:sugar phosphate isomerase/epimerase